MERQLRILHLEDNKFGSRLIREKLEEEWPDCLVELVETEADFCSALERGDLDLILADYSLPEFDGLKALQIVRQRLPEVPFIFLSGTMGEIVAIEAIKNGATDYVLKSGIFRLIPAIQRALQERDERNERQELQNIITKLLFALEQAPLSIVITDAAGVIEYVNPKLAEITGYTFKELRGRKPGIFKSPLTDPAVHENLWKTISQGTIWKGEFCNRKKNGDLYYESATIAPVKNLEGVITNYIGIREDISVKRALESQLQQAQKMEIIGTLASGIAHDFNNILTVIAGYGEILKMKLATDGSLVALVDQILLAQARATEMTRSLLTFSRKEELRLAPVRLNEIVRGLEKSLLRLLREDIEFKVEPSVLSMPVMADKGQIEQVIFNLVVNARDAMPDGGRLLLRIEEIAVTEGQPVADEAFDVGKYALLTVADSGCGMDKMTRERIFEPFFTTKDVGKGTGLGMSIVYGIVTKHNGKITVRSEPGRGTTFSIYLPLMEQSANIAEQPAEKAVTSGNETILVVDDDDGVRQILAALLKAQGYKVLVAENGEEGVRIFSDNREEIRLVLTDVIMPKKNGREMCQEICRIKADFPVVFMSGYADSIINDQDDPEKKFPFLSKPISQASLLALLREMIDGQGVDAAARMSSPAGVPSEA